MDILGMVAIKRDRSALLHLQSILCLTFDLFDEATTSGVA